VASVDVAQPPSAVFGPANLTSARAFHAPAVAGGSRRGGRILIRRIQENERIGSMDRHFHTSLDTGTVWPPPKSEPTPQGVDGWRSGKKKHKKKGKTVIVCNSATTCVVGSDSQVAAEF
jgi:hypothetical protein